MHKVLGIDTGPNRHITNAPVFEVMKPPYCLFTETVTD